MVLAAARPGLRRNAAAVAAFAPTSLPGLTVWFDAGQITGVTDGVAVATWQDRSGNSANATQATLAKQPIYRSTGVLLTPAGKPIVQFDGVSNSMSFTNTAVNNSVTIFAVASVPSVTAAPNVFDATGTSRIQLGIRSNFWEWFENGTVSNAGSAVANTYAVINASSGTTAVVTFLNGVAGDSTSVTASTTLSSVAAIGSSAAGTSEFLAGNVAELILYNRVISAAERLQVQTYLKTKHGTP